MKVRAGPVPEIVTWTKPLVQPGRLYHRDLNMWGRGDG